jgi:putative ABC transport system substrate-binding protein
MRRRDFITVLGGAAAASVPWGGAVAQAVGSILRIGIVSPAASKSTPLFDTFRARLKELGYVENRDIVIEFGLAAGALEKVPALAVDLVRQPVDVLVADGAHVIGVLQSLTKTIPTVGIIGVDPVAAGFVSSLARPGGNFTGVATFAIELHVKRLALLKEAIPGVVRVAVLIDGSQDPQGLVFETMEQSALKLGLRLERLDGPRRAEDLTGVLRREVLTKFDGLVIGSGPLFWNNRTRIATLAAESGRPAIYPERDYVDAGGLMCYGPNIPAVFRRLAELVDRILKGARPAELPIEQVSRLDFVINLRTAHTLGLEMPAMLLARANEVIE